MVRRSPSARFMGGAWVFPGGVVDPEDLDPIALASIEGLSDPDLGPWLAAAFREVVEETGIWLTGEPFVEAARGGIVFEIARDRELRFAGDRTAYFANWITPTMVPVRFDARFFIAAIPEAVTPAPDEREIDAAAYVAPAEALRRATAGDWLVPFPTQRTLQQLADFVDVESALEEWRHKPVVAVQPRMRIGSDGALEVVMPDDPGYEDLEDFAPDPDALKQAARVSASRGRPLAEVSDDEH